MKKKLALAFAVLAMAIALGAPTPAQAWECEQLTGTTWYCNDNGQWYFVDCGSGKCIYHKEPV